MEGESYSRISAKTLDSVTSPQNQKGNILEAEGRGPVAAEGFADAAREETPALPSGNRLPTSLEFQAMKRTSWKTLGL